MAVDVASTASDCGARRDDEAALLPLAHEDVVLEHGVTQCSSAVDGRRRRWRPVAGVVVALIAAAVSAVALLSLHAAGGLRAWQGSSPSNKLLWSLWCTGGPGPAIWQANAVGDPVPVKVLTYNLFWWSLFKQRHGNGGSAGKLIAESSKTQVYDVMAFQECEDLKLVLTDAGMQGKYTFFPGENGLCQAWRSETWELDSQGQNPVAEDGKAQYYGIRDVQWSRLIHKTTRQPLLFLNHHGPLPMGSGGQCGEVATAGNILTVIASKGQVGDAVILVGDFNTGESKGEISALETQLNRAFHGTCDGGVDNIFTNIAPPHVVDSANLGGGGSDHDALQTTIWIEPGAEHAVDVTAPAILDDGCDCAWANHPHSCEGEGDGSHCNDVCCKRV